MYREKTLSIKKHKLIKMRFICCFSPGKKDAADINSSKPFKQFVFGGIWESDTPQICQNISL